MLPSRTFHKVMLSFDFQAFVGNFVGALCRSFCRIPPLFRQADRQSKMTKWKMALLGRALVKAHFRSVLQRLCLSLVFAGHVLAVRAENVPVEAPAIPATSAPESSSKLLV